MKFRIKANVKPLKETTRKMLDECIADILGGKFDDAMLDGTHVWRKVGGVEIFDSTTVKVIYGETKPETITSLCAALSDYGCKLDSNYLKG